MTPVEERAGEAATVWRHHGERAPLFVAERIGSLAMADDMAGVERWQQIAAALDMLMRSARQ